MQEKETQISDWLENAEARAILSLIDDTARTACRAFFDSINACEGSLWWKYPETDYLEICFNSGPNANLLEGSIRQPLSEGIVSMVYHTGEAIYTNQLQNNPEHSKEVDLLLDQHTHSMIVAPILLFGEPVAVISAVILNENLDHDFEYSDLGAIQHLAELLRSYWESQLLHELS